MITLTPRQREILIRMRDDEEEIVAYGLEVWIEQDRISWRTLNFFLQHCLVSQNGMEKAYYHINESGKLLLSGHSLIYRMADGTYTDDWRSWKPNPG